MTARSKKKKSSVPQWYIVIGRIPFDDEDTPGVIYADSEGDAILQYETELRGGVERSDDNDPEEDPLIISMFACGPHKPTIIRTP
jgi:hypothetical protein